MHSQGYLGNLEGLTFSVGYLGHCSWSNILRSCRWGKCIWIGKQMLVLWISQYCTLWFHEGKQLFFICEFLLTYTHVKNRLSAYKLVKSHKQQRHITYLHLNSCLISLMKIWLVAYKHLRNASACDNLVVTYTKVNFIKHCSSFLQSKPVEDYYRSQRKLLDFDVSGGIPQTWPKLLEALKLDVDADGTKERGWRYEL